MSFWDVIAGGAIASGTSFALAWQQDHRDTRSVSAKAAAKWATLQMSTISDMQENLKQGASFISKTLVEMSERRFRGKTRIPDLLPFTRALMLCSRLEDEELARDVRAWIRHNRELISGEYPLEQDWIAVREQRIILQDRLGAALKAYHGR